MMRSQCLLSWCLITDFQQGIWGFTFYFLQNWMAKVKRELFAFSDNNIWERESQLTWQLLFGEGRTGVSWEQWQCVISRCWRRSRNGSPLFAHSSRIEFFVTEIGFFTPKARQVFLCFSLCARIGFRQSAEKKKQKKLSALSEFLRGIPTQSLRVRTGTVDRTLHSIQNRSTAFQVTAGKSSRAIFSAHQDLQRGATFRIKRGGKRDCQWMIWPLVFWLSWLEKVAGSYPKANPFLFRWSTAWENA